MVGFVRVPHDLGHRIFRVTTGQEPGMTDLGFFQENIHDRPQESNADYLWRSSLSRNQGKICAGKPGTLVDIWMFANYLSDDENYFTCDFKYSQTL
jgi:hypothetical protein